MMSTPKPLHDTSADRSTKRYMHLACQVAGRPAVPDGRPVHVACARPFSKFGDSLDSGV